MKATPEEILSILTLGQLGIINSIISIANKHIYYSKKEDKNILNGESFLSEIKEIGEKFKANYFSPHTP